MKINQNYLLNIFLKFADEISTLSPLVKEKYIALRNKGHTATFSDFEGELLYCLIRDREPNVVFEISPDCGYSTIYITEALKKNKSGKLYSFEIENKKRGEKTQTLIQNNLIQPVYENIEFIIGDASETIKNINVNPDIVLIDSCHDKWFAEWYTKELFPLVKDILLIQDIIFYNREENSGEAKYLLNFIKENNYNYISLGVLERINQFIEARLNSFPRRNYETNSIIISNSEEIDNIPGNNLSIDFTNGILDQSYYKLNKAKILNTLVSVPKTAINHRFVMQMYDFEIDKKIKKTYLELIFSFMFSIDNKKMYSEIMIWSLKNYDFLLALKSIIIILLHKPQYVPNILNNIKNILVKKIF